MRQPKIRRSRRYTSGAGTADLPLIEQMTPTRAPTIESDVLVPAAQAMLFGLVIGSAVVLVAWAGWAVRLWPWWPVVVTVVAGLALSQRLLAMQDTLWRIESFADVDIDGDGDVGEPEPEPADHWPVTISGPQVDEAQQMRRQERFVDEFSTFVKGCKLNTSLRRWEKQLGREKYQAWRDKLIELGWAEWKSEGSPAQGWQLAYDPDDIIEAVGFDHFSRQFVREVTQ